MTQIYHVIQSTSDRHVLDPERGMVLRREIEMKPADTAAIKHGEDTYQVANDKTFDVPEHVAAHFLRQPGWHQGPNPFAEQEAEPEKPARAKAKATAAG